MNRRNRHPIFCSIILLMIVLACAMPGQAAEPTLATDPNSLSTFIAGTSQALAVQTQQAAALITPSDTPTVLPTETPLTAPEMSVEKTTLVIQSDQSTVFTDYKAGIEITLPPIWMAFRIGEKEYYKAWESEFVKSNPSFAENVAGLQSTDVSSARLFAFDIRPGYVLNGYYTEISVIYEENDLRTLEEWLEVEKDKPQFTDFELLSTTYRDTPNGIHVLTLEQKMGRAGDDGFIYYREIYFSVPSGTVFIDCYSDFEFKDAVIADFDQVVDSIVLLDQ